MLYRVKELRVAGPAGTAAVSHTRQSCTHTFFDCTGMLCYREIFVRIVFAAASIVGRLLLLPNPPPR
jgi:hypothetical protein